MHEYFQGTVGERIQDLLREKKMTQAVLAQRTQISKATLNRYITDENSRIPPERAADRPGVGRLDGFPAWRNRHSIQNQL